MNDTDHLPPVMRQVLAQTPTGPRMLTYPRLAPLDGQRRLVDEAVAQARRAGLRLPSNVDLVYVNPPLNQRGKRCGSRTAASRSRSTLPPESGPGELRATTLHELQHVADLAGGTMLNTPAERIAFEHRTILFSSRMMAAGG